jgi:hypothetical protein
MVSAMVVGGEKRATEPGCGCTGLSSSRRSVKLLSWNLSFFVITVTALHDVLSDSAKLEQVKKLQRQLEEEIDLHVVFGEAVTQNATSMLKSSMKLPHKVLQTNTTWRWRVLFS